MPSDNDQQKPWTSYDRTVAAYERAAEELAKVYDALGADVLLGRVRDVLPPAGLALDVGAGSGRDARWLRSHGFEVVAVEPVAWFRERGSSDTGTGIAWVDDRLPALAVIGEMHMSFDLIVLSAVWQHVAPADRPVAFRTLAGLLRPGGILVMTLRAGLAPADRLMYPTSREEIERLAEAGGLDVAKMEAAADRQGRPRVSWTVAALRSRLPNSYQNDT